ncbi:hypothetical protein ACJX0J_035902, partial [Zea mays]
NMLEDGDRNLMEDSDGDSSMPDWMKYGSRESSIMGGQNSDNRKLLHNEKEFWMKDEQKRHTGEQKSDYMGSLETYAMLHSLELPIYIVPSFKVIILEIFSKQINAMYSASIAIYYCLLLDMFHYDEFAFMYYAHLISYLLSDIKSHMFIHIG